jgi:hypothetical protein
MSKGKLAAIIAGAAVIVVVIVIVIPRLTAGAGQIRDWHDLNAIREDLTGNYRLMRHLDANSEGYAEVAGPDANGGRGWQPIGTYENQFTGTFDGRGYTIGDLFIDRPDEDGVGFFGSVDEGASIRNVGLVDANVIGRDGVGGLVGDNWGGTLANSYSTGTVTGNAYVGGLVGWNVATVFACYSASNVTGNGTVGGATDGSTGGLVGANAGIMIESYSSGSVTGVYAVGGLLGDNVEGTVIFCYSISTVKGDEKVGGLVGFNDGTVSNCYWDKDTSGIDVSDGGTGKTTAEMMSIATFTDTETDGLNEPWDMTAVAPGAIDRAFAWNIVDGETYPFLNWQST